MNGGRPSLYGADSFGTLPPPLPQLAGVSVAVRMTAARNPTVSVVLPVRNAIDTLPECLASIRGQTLTDHEVVAVDDESTDGSSELLMQAAAVEPRLRVLQPGRIGLVEALNLGTREARAPLIARMDADDVMLPGRLAAQHRYLVDRPDITLVASRVELFPPQLVRAGYREYVRWQDECLEPEQIAANIYVEAPFAHPSVTMRREPLLRLGGYRAGPFPEDYDLWLRMHAAGLRMAKLPDILLRWRESGDRVSRTDERYSRTRFDALRAGHLAADPRVRNAAELVVWGAGRRTRARARLLLNHGLRISAWVDIDERKIGNRLDGVPVHRPEWLDREPHPFVLVYVTNHGARDLIASSLRRWGYRRGFDFLPVG